jgi:hypothetical protein
VYRAFVNSLPPIPENVTPQQRRELQHLYTAANALASGAYGFRPAVMQTLNDVIQKYDDALSSLPSEAYRTMADIQAETDERHRSEDREQRLLELDMRNRASLAVADKAAKAKADKEKTAAREKAEEKYLDYHETKAEILDRWLQEFEAGTRSGAKPTEAAVVEYLRDVRRIDEPPDPREPPLIRSADEYNRLEPGTFYRHAGDGSLREKADNPKGVSRWQYD